MSAFIRDIGKTLTRATPVQHMLGRALAGYITLVARTGPQRVVPQDAFAQTTALQPFIATFWHGQHLMIPYARPDRSWPFSVLISRHDDGEFNAIAAQCFDIEPIRAAGAAQKRNAAKIAQKGGVSGLRQMLRTLAGGRNVALTADVPKIARVCGEGIITLARLSGRPIVPVAYATRHRVTMKSWDRAALNLPFSVNALAFAEPIVVAREADNDAQESARRTVEAALNDATARAYALAGDVPNTKGAHRHV